MNWLNQPNDEPEIGGPRHGTLSIHSGVPVVQRDHPFNCATKLNPCKKKIQRPVTFSRPIREAVLTLDLVDTILLGLTTIEPVPEIVMLSFEIRDRQKLVRRLILGGDVITFNHPRQERQYTRLRQALKKEIEAYFNDEPLIDPLIYFNTVLCCVTDLVEQAKRTIRTELIDAWDALLEKMAELSEEITDDVKPEYRTPAYECHWNIKAQHLAGKFRRIITE